MEACGRDEELRHRRLRGHFTKPLPAKPPAGGDPEEPQLSNKGPSIPQWLWG